MIRKSLIASGVVLLLAAVSAFVYDKNESNSIDEIFNANVEALTDSETGIPTLPCIQSISTCSYVVKDAAGNYYTASTAGMKNI